MKRGIKLVGMVLVALGLVSVVAHFATMPAHAQAGGPRVDLATIHGVIDQFTQGYVERILSNARDDGSTTVVFVVDTPGGDLQATRNIVEDLLVSPVPTIVYVSPSGARAGSAGVFITYGANLAAMAPGTNIGAAHPVDSTGGDITGTLGTKITNDSAAFIRTVATQRGRDANWGEDAVRNSVSITEQEALQKGVINFVARDVNDLLTQANGHTVKLTSGDVTLNTLNADVHQEDMNFFEQFFQLLLDPNIALILLNVGTIAIIAEIYNPGAVIPAIVGVICLTLAAVALYGLPTNWAAVILIIAGIGMMVLDIKVTGFALTIGGIISFLLGAFFLFRPLTPPEPTAPDVSVSPIVVGVLILFTASFFIFILAAAVRSRSLPILTGPQTFLGAVGVARTALNPQGIVLVKSEEWTALAQDPPIQAGETVHVLSTDGLTLKVEKTPKK